MAEIILTSEGLVPSKKNKVHHKKGGGGFYDSETRREIDWLVMNFRMEWRKLGYLSPLIGNLRVHTEIHTNRSQDTDNMHTTLLDCLQTAGIIKNDKQVSHGSYERIMLGEKDVDKARVRVFVFLMS